MGGTIEVKTQKGEGTELTMRLRFRTAAPARWADSARAAASSAVVEASLWRPASRSMPARLRAASGSPDTARAGRPWSSGMSGSGVLRAARRKSRVAVNSVPWPFLEATVMVPPIISTMFLAMAMPRPVPWMPDTVELRARTKGSKTVLRNSSSIPMPLSRQRNS